MAAERVRTDGSGNQVAFAPVTLRRSGKLVVLEVAARNVTPAGTGENKVNVPSMLIGLEARFVDVTLVDPVHAKRYLVVQDSKESCLCTSFAGGLEVARGGTAVLTAYFPAPPADVQRLDVTVNKVGTFPAVPLT
jgi:hypothetical protein